MRALFLVAALLFANVSFAGAPPRTTFLGRYLVSDIIENDQVRQGTLCKPYVDENGTGRDADFRCGQKLLVFNDQAAGQIAMFLAPESASDESLRTFSVFRAALFSQNRKCKTSIAMGDISGLFESNVCRGFKVTGTDEYMFFPNMEPKPGQENDATAEAIARAIVTGAMTGLPIGLASVYFIEVNGPKSPEILIHELTTGVAFLSTVTFRNLIKLTPIN